MVPERQRREPAREIRDRKPRNQMGSWGRMTRALICLPWGWGEGLILPGSSAKET